MPNCENRSNLTSPPWQLTSLTNSCCGLGNVILEKDRRIFTSQGKMDKLDIQFHLLLAHATGNKLLLTVLQFAFKCTEHVRERSHQTATGRRIHLGHQLIFEAVTAHNAEVPNTL